jgi:hypothetical protein
MLERGGAWFETLRVVPRPKQNRRPAAKASQAYAAELRSLTAEVFVRAFRQRLGRPHHAHIATIAAVASGIETDADFVKKVAGRRSRSSDSG